MKVDFKTLLATVDTTWGGKTRYGSEAADEALSALASAVAATGKKGKLTIVVSMAANSRTEVSSSVTITGKIPEPSALPSRLYLDPSGSLRLDDPEQPSLVPMQPRRAEDGGRKE